MSELQISPFIPAGQPSMSTREIADLTGASHDNVMKTVRGLIAKGVVFQNETPYVHPQNGQTYAEFLLNFRDTMVVVSGYSAELRARIIDRWQALEAERTPAAVQGLSPGDIALQLAHAVIARDADLRIANTKVDTLEAAKTELEHHVEIITPKAEIYDKYLNAEGLMSLQDLGRSLGQPPNKFIDHLKGKWLFESRGQWLPYERYGEQGIGIFAVKSGIFGDKVRRRTMATPKAVLYFARKLEADQRKAAA